MNNSTYQTLCKKRQSNSDHIMKTHTCIATFLLDPIYSARHHLLVKKYSAQDWPMRNTTENRANLRPVTTHRNELGTVSKI